MLLLRAVDGKFAIADPECPSTAIRLRAADASVIEACAYLGVGVDAAARLTADVSCPSGLRVVPGSEAFFGASATTVAHRKGSLLRYHTDQFNTHRVARLGAEALDRKRQASLRLHHQHH